MSIFDEQAIEAAAKAIYIADVSPERPKAWEDLDGTVYQEKNLRIIYLTFARAASRTLEASLRERGKLRDGEGYQSESQDIWYANSHLMIDTEKKFPVAIIRMEKP